MIQETEEFKALKAAEIAQAEDENAKTLLMEFNLRRMNLGRDIQEGKITEAEAIEFVNSIKKKHSDARHNVYAYVLREGFASRFSDQE